MENAWVKFMQNYSWYFLATKGTLLDPSLEYAGKPTIDILTSAVQNITQSSKEILGHPVAIGTIAHPVYFTQAPLSSMVRAAEQVDSSFDAYFRDYRWIRNTYSAAAFTRSREYCTADLVMTSKPEDPSNIIMMLDYDSDHLDIFAGDSTAQGPSFHGRTVATMRSDGKLNEENAHQALNHAIEEYLTPVKGHASFKPHLDELHSIIITGEVTQEDIAFLSSLLKEVLPEHHHKLQVEQPGYQAAFGASCVNHIFRMHMKKRDQMYSLRREL